MAEKLATTERLVTLAKLVIQMRQAQKAYFKNRLQGDLTRSKQLERSVDALLDGLTFPPEAPKEQQQEFGTGGWMSAR